MILGREDARYNGVACKGHLLQATLRTAVKKNRNPRITNDRMRAGLGEHHLVVW